MASKKQKKSSATNTSPSTITTRFASHSNRVTKNNKSSTEIEKAKLYTDKKPAQTQVKKKETKQKKINKCSICLKVFKGL